MKVYITTDMEGISGIVSEEQTFRTGSLYERGKKLFVGDVNAAVEGAYAGGADEIIVADFHAGWYNIMIDELSPKAKLLSGGAGGGPKFAYLDSSSDVMLCIGYHAKAGTQSAVLEHTMNSREWTYCKVNGEEVGELALDAAMAGFYDVPVVMVSGDDKLCSEARALLGENIEAAEVKKGLARQRALCLPIDKARKEIFECAKNAMTLKDRVKPFKFEEPLEIEIKYKHTGLADKYFAEGAGMERKDGYTIVYRYKNIAEWFGGAWEE